MDRDESLQKFEQYLQRRFPERRTSKDYLSDLRQFVAFCQKPWREVSLHDIDAFVDQQRARGLQPATINRRVAALKTFFDFLAEETGDLSWPNPVRFKRHAGKRPHPLPRDLRDEDLERLWAVIPSARDRAWLVLMVRAGLRVGEVVTLELGDLLSEPQGQQPARLRVCGKGRKERLVLLSADAYAVLQAWLAERPPSQETALFLNERGRPLSANGIQWLLHGYGRQAGFDLTPHQLRHTFARQVTEAGMPVTSLGKLLGHAQITTTQIYTAGADPDLAHAYQSAMGRLESPPPQTPPADPAPLPPPPDPVLPAPASAAVEVPEPQEPDWDHWAPQLPEPFRQASLDYVKRRYPTWPVRQRRGRALGLLSELHGLWTWFLAVRALSHPGQLSLQDLWAYQTDQQAKGYAAGTINRRTDYLLGIARQLADREQPLDNSVFRLRYLPRPQSLPRHLSEAESQTLEAFLQAEARQADLRKRLRAACLLLMLNSGLRSGECVALHFQDLDLSGKRLIVRQGKGQRDRLVYLSESTGQAIQAYLQGAQRSPSDPLWQYPNGKPMSQAWLAGQVAKVGQALGMEPLYPHRLRHTCATRLLNAGMEITRIQKLLGHERISTTMIYARVQDATVEADYRRALRQIEQRQMPLSGQPVPVEEWPTQVIKVPETLDNSV